MRGETACHWDDTSAADCVALDAHERDRRRVVLTGERGVTFLLDLPHATALRDGDGLVLDDGTMVRVNGWPEPLAEIAAANSRDLARLAWHIGNRHIDVQIVGDRLRIRRDHVIEDMLRGLGAGVTPIEAPFDPESGAYDHRHSHNLCDHKSMAREKGASLPLTAAALYRLMAWLSPAYPVGAFSYSSGIEWAVEAGDISDSETLKRRLAAMIGEGLWLLRCGCFSFMPTTRSKPSDDAALRAVAELAAAFVPSKERLLETTAQGRAFVDADPARHGPAPRSPRLESRMARDRSQCRLPSAPPAPDMALPASPRCTPSFMPSWRTGFPPACGSSRSARRTASARSPPSNPPLRRPQPVR